MHNEKSPTPALADLDKQSEREAFINWSQVFHRNARSYTARDFDHGLVAWLARAALARRAAQPVAPVQADYPAGAIHNGEVLAERLENIYDFECEAGPLRNCSEWIELRRCLRYLADYVATPSSQIAEVAELRRVEPGALASSIAELDAWLETDGCDPLTVGQGESVGLVLHELKRLRAICPECKGTGMADSGGTHPWGEPALIPCGCDAIAASRRAVASPLPQARIEELYFAAVQQSENADDTEHTSIITRFARAIEREVPAPASAGQAKTGCNGMVFEGHPYCVGPCADCDLARKIGVRAVQPAEGAGQAVGQIRDDIERTGVVWFGPRPPHRTNLYAGAGQAGQVAEKAAMFDYLCATTTAIRNPETGERIECTPEEFEASVRLSMGLKLTERAAAPADTQDTARYRAARSNAVIVQEGLTGRVIVSLPLPADYHDYDSASALFDVCLDRATQQPSAQKGGQ